jgi:malate dehydrogenase (oxaloacetate-decarboxylating)(NADP+)
VAEIHPTLVNEAVDVATLIFDRGLARVPRPADIGAWLRAQVYDPSYA